MTQARSEEFIATQRSLLARTHEDTERLRTLKVDVVRDPGDYSEYLAEKVRFIPSLSSSRISFSRALMKIHLDAA